MIKHINIVNNQSGEIVEILIKDFSGRTIDRYKFNGKNGLFYGKIIENLYEKFGFKPIINLNEAVIIRNIPEKNFFNS